MLQKRWRSGHCLFQESHIISGLDGENTATYLLDSIPLSLAHYLGLPGASQTFSFRYCLASSSSQHHFFCLEFPLLDDQGFQALTDSSDNKSQRKWVPPLSFSSVPHDSMSMRKDERQFPTSHKGHKEYKSPVDKLPNHQRPSINSDF